MMGRIIASIFSLFFICLCIVAFGMYGQIAATIVWAFFTETFSIGHIFLAFLVLPYAVIGAGLMVLWIACLWSEITDD
jgi:hypothetical protein